MHTSTPRSCGAPAAGPLLTPRRAALAAGLAVIVGLAASNPGEQAHRDAAGDPGFCRYHNYLVFSTLTVMELDGEEHRLSAGLLGTVHTIDTPRRV